MPRNLDLTTLRSFVAVADAGGVTRAAGFLNLTQSAVSMQLKRLEQALDTSLIDRSARRVALTAAGEKLLGYARRMLEQNDEAYERLTDQAYVGEIVLGVPHDIVYPAIPDVLHRYNAEYPSMKVQLISSYTNKLCEMFARGACDIILTTEDGVDAGGETLAIGDLVWVGAPGGSAWKARPLRLAFENNCLFRKGIAAALDQAGMQWEMAVESESTRTVEASVRADLAVYASIAGHEAPYLEKISHNNTLPELPRTHINMYAAETGLSRPVADMVDFLRQAYQAL
jgi:DNA-binding transcriptional LysR family regulator